MKPGLEISQGCDEPVEFRQVRNAGRQDKIVEVLSNFLGGLARPVAQLLPESAPCQISGGIREFRVSEPDSYELSKVALWERGATLVRFSHPAVSVPSIVFPAGLDQQMR